VSNVHPSYKHLLGARLREVQNKPLADVKKLATQIFPAENEFGASRSLLIILSSNRYISALFSIHQEELTFTFQNLEDSIVDETIPYSVAADERESILWQAPSWEEFKSDSSPFSYQWIIPEKVAYLKIKEMVSRESFEFMNYSGRTDLSKQIERYFRNSLQKIPPDDPKEAIAKIPSLTETVFDLLHDMRNKNAEYLIIDLRNNSGGWSDILIPIYYMLYGDKYFEYQFPIAFATKISKAYLNMYGRTLEELNAKYNSSYELGEYIFSESELLSADQQRNEYLTNLKNRNYSFLSYINQLDGKPIYTPQIIMLVNAFTFSAAYHFMYHLWHLGAVTIGVPSAQSGNSFVDATPFTLPHTQLSGFVSRHFSQMIWRKARFLSLNSIYNGKITNLIDLIYTAI
jgi:hypothetical protein